MFNIFVFLFVIRDKKGVKVVFCVLEEMFVVGVSVFSWVGKIDVEKSNIFGDRVLFV